MNLKRIKQGRPFLLVSCLLKITRQTVFCTPLLSLNPYQWLVNAFQCGWTCICPQSCIVVSCLFSKVNKQILDTSGKKENLAPQCASCRCYANISVLSTCFVHWWTLDCVHKLTTDHLRTIWVKYYIRKSYVFCDALTGLYISLKYFIFLEVRRS